VNRKGKILFRIGTNVLFYACVAVMLRLFLQVFFFASFRVPTGSMEPEIWPGDYVLVSKAVFGARLFNILPTLRLEQVNIHRAPGLRKIRRNDVLVFNTPYPHTQERMEMHILKYLVKRCIGLPGDSLLIENGRYRVKGADAPPEDRTVGREQSARPKGGIFYGDTPPCFPKDSIIQWNATDFGPLYIPAKGDTVPMNRDHYVLYRTLIEWETKGVLTFRDSTVYLNSHPVANYIFHSDYYFMAGDNVNNSLDSRHWGLVPGDYIAGKVWLVWKSCDPYTDKFRWKRWLKQIK
jgi:signal peptidase I